MVCPSVCLTDLNSGTTGNKAARERYTRLQRNNRSKNNVADLAKTAEFWQEKPAPPWTKFRDPTHQSRCACVFITCTTGSQPLERLVWRSLTPPSKIGKGSGEPRIIDLCHKQNSGSSNQISERNSYIIPLRHYHLRALCARAGGRDGASVAENRAALGAKEAIYEEVRM